MVGLLQAGVGSLTSPEGIELLEHGRLCVLLSLLWGVVSGEGARTSGHTVWGRRLWSDSSTKPAIAQNITAKHDHEE